MLQPGTTSTSATPRCRLSQFSVLVQRAPWVVRIPWTTSHESVTHVSERCNPCPRTKHPLVQGGTLIVGRGRKGPLPAFLVVVLVLVLDECSGRDPCCDQVATARLRFPKTPL